MNILVISNLYPPHGIGGYEERCMQTVHALRKRGHTINVLTSDHVVDGRATGDEPGIYRRLQVHGFYGHPWLPIHQLYKLEQANQITMQSLIDELKPDLVHVWNMGGISKSLLHTLEQSPRPLVYDISDHWIARSLKADVWLSWWNDPGSIMRTTLRGLASITGMRRSINAKVPTNSVRQLKFKHIYFCSQYMRDTTVKQGYPVAHAKIAYCGVETERFTRKLEYNTPRKFLWVGRLAEDKDPMTALKGFLRARQSCDTPITLDIYGRGEAEYVDQLKAEISKSQADAYVQLKSATHDEMRHLYAQYDGYIFSSNWGEPFALTPLEAMSAGVPVIMCPDGGDAELLHDGDNAIKFSAASPSSLAGAIMRLLQLPDHGQKMSRIARQLVEERFTVEVMTDTIEGILLRAAGARHG
ncbi:glycosyltransferase family 4 protein [Coraliomargarita sp. SDUM461004]|uniref:Glycosyltransferase family 4 protein n=1 Tax=Thalassobacterium sedimentorum TaxID=3041258 RepID=A0ABU1AG68_9BACT|nr:glycosyltransferase family 4 protein [Coraliomargarita sp. SDUM461004]MDQ8193812.1 glycosyltransferase family 4 protein [Coraliomargarita sp. SDUM461004]